MPQSLSRNCRRCGIGFLIDPEDLAFYAKVDVPPPTKCPRCRERQRLLNINHLNLFRRKSDASGAMILSSYPPQSPVKVFEQQYWWGDAWDALQYGRPFDFSRRFFDQFAELHRSVPAPALFTDYLHDENCEYTNYSGRDKDCYLIFDSDENRECYYSYTIRNSRSSYDVYRSQNLELCYETLDSRTCYRSAYLYNCEGCEESALLANCIGCKQCLMCCNLRHKEYHVLNRPVSRDEFAALRASLARHSTLGEARKTFAEFRKRFPERALRGFHNENVSGDYLVHCKDSHHCFDCIDMRDCRYCTQAFMRLNDCWDCYATGEGELLYECSNLGYNAFNLRFCAQSLNQVRDLTYCISCWNGSHDLFGCSGLKKKSYCILNTQYSRDEYEALVPRIIAHMQRTGEWGEFFPPQVSLIPYNVSMAYEYFPMGKQEALAEGLSWLEEDVREYQPQTYVVPDDSAQTADDVTKALLACGECRKNFKILAQELHFYRDMALPLPRCCFFCRHRARAKNRYPRTLWSSRCSKCGGEMVTSCDPRLKLAVYCDHCFAEALG